MAEKRQESGFTVTDRRLFTEDGEWRQDIREEQKRLRPRFLYQASRKRRRLASTHPPGQRFLRCRPRPNNKRKQMRTEIIRRFGLARRTQWTQCQRIRDDVRALSGLALYDRDAAVGIDASAGGAASAGHHRSAPDYRHAGAAGGKNEGQSDFHGRKFSAEQPLRGTHGVCGSDQCAVASATTRSSHGN